MTDVKNKLQDLLLQFRALEGHPGLWPAAPRKACGVASALLVIACGWWLIWTAQWEALATGDAEEEKQKQAFQTKLAQARSLSVLRIQKQQVEQQVKTLEQQLPGKAEMDALLSDINQVGVARGLQFELFKPGQVQLRDYYAELPVDIKLTGSYHALASFTSDIAQLPRIVTLDKINIINLRDGAQSFDAVVRTFRYLDKDEVVLHKKQAADKQALDKQRERK
jgi:type IV pilus assembly protein PilO